MVGDGGREGDMRAGHHAQKHAERERATKMEKGVSMGRWGGTCPKELQNGILKERYAAGIGTSPVPPPQPAHKSIYAGRAYNVNSWVL